MTTERITVKATDLQPGDRIYRGPWRGSSGGEGLTVKTAEQRVRFTTDRYNMTFDADTEFIIDRPLPTVTIEIPRDVAVAYAAAAQTASAAASVRQACSAALSITTADPDARPLNPVLRVGALVRRTRWEHEATGRYGVGTVVAVHGRDVRVVGPNGKESYWGRSSFEVVG